MAWLMLLIPDLRKANKIDQKQSQISSEKPPESWCWYGRPTVLQSTADSVAQSFYYAAIRDPSKPANQRSRSGCRIINSDEASPIILPPIPGTIAETEPFTAVNLGPLLGQGGSGHVYRGTWNGATVAVKVCHSLTSVLPLWRLLDTIYFFVCFCLYHSFNLFVCRLDKHS